MEPAARAWELMVSRAMACEAWGCNQSGLAFDCPGSMFRCSVLLVSRKACVLVIATNWTAGSRTTARASVGLGVGVVLAEYLKTAPRLVSAARVAALRRSDEALSARCVYSEYRNNLSAIVRRL